MAEISYRGLSSTEVEDSRKIHGANILTPPAKTSTWRLLLEKFEDPIIQILLAAWVLAMIIAGVECWGEGKGPVAFLEPAGIFFAIMLATLTGFYFEQRANKAFSILNTVNDDILVTVMRDGKVTEIPRKDVVVGDIVILNAGNEIPADGTLLESLSLQVNESTLTGEPLCNKTTIEADFDSEATYPSNKVMRGTTVADGHGVMKVDLVGDDTAYGKVYEGAQIDNSVETPLQSQLRRLASIISKFGYTIAGCTFVLLVAKFFWYYPDASLMDTISHLLSYFMLAVTLIVVSVPEGLPMSVTLSLALSMNRMLKTNNLVRKMHACETMGAATVICTDKTGTLTQNRMTVADTAFFALPGQSLSSDFNSDVIIKNIAINSTANLSVDSAGEVSTIGNPTEAALLLWLNSKGVDYAQIRSNNRIVSQLTFSTERKYMATVITQADGSHLLLLKGAPEIVFSLCDNVATTDKVASKQEYDSEVNKLLAQYQSKAMRTLGLAYKILSPDDNLSPYQNGRLTLSNLTFLGVVAISDPVRVDVPDAVVECRKAGIDVKIVTGDTSGTAKEIARQIGTWDDLCSDNDIITGSDFEALSDEEASKRIQSLKVMCRARPLDKQRLVHLLQQQGEVVAVTGDGTNDAPALKAAQVGLSMGDGTSVAKEASDITIINNSFASITKAVMWGRSLYRNIQRFLLFQLTINVAACLIVLIGSLVGAESPLTITQMLYVNLIMDTFAAAAFASLPPAKSVMNDAPRKNSDPIIDSSMWVWIGSIAAIFVAGLLGMLMYFESDNVLSQYEISIFFATFVMLQFWNMFNAKAFKTGSSAFAGIWHCKTFNWIEVTILLGLFLIVTFGGTMFSVVPLSSHDWGMIALITSPVLIVGEIIRGIKSVLHRKK